MKTLQNGKDTRGRKNRTVKWYLIGVCVALSIVLSVTGIYLLMSEDSVEDTSGMSPAVIHSTEEAAKITSEEAEETTSIADMEHETAESIADMEYENAEAAHPREEPAPIAVKSIENLLRTAIQPIGNTMYVWGGGWNEEDTGAGVDAITMGVSPRWEEFAAKQDASYNYEKTKYQLRDGLDCSGYIGWCVYNVMEQENGKAGYVMKAREMAAVFAGYGWGEYCEAAQVSDWKAGDIMSMKGHVWMALGSCEDGSVVLVHASPPGVSLAGTLLSDGGRSEAVALAEQYMSTYFPEWYARFPDCSKKNSYLVQSAAMRWNRETLSDEEGLTEMDAAAVLRRIFEEQ